MTPLKSEEPALTLFAIGGVFGASWVRYGPKGPQFVAGGLAVVVLAALAVVMPSIGTIVEAFELWWLAIAAVVVIALASVGTWSLLRSASVR